MQLNELIHIDDITVLGDMKYYFLGGGGGGLLLLIPKCEVD